MSDSEQHHWVKESSSLLEGGKGTETIMAVISFKAREDSINGASSISACRWFPS